MRVQLEGFTDVSDILQAGVYALVKRGVVIYVGKSKTLYSRIYAHRTTAARAARGKAIPSWMPIKGFVFDQVCVRPCPVADLDRLEEEMINRYKPRYNWGLKNGLKTSLVTLPNGLRLNAPRALIGIERRI